MWPHHTHFESKESCNLICYCQLSPIHLEFKFVWFLDNNKQNEQVKFSITRVTNYVLFLCVIYFFFIKILLMLKKEDHGESVFSLHLLFHLWGWRCQLLTSFYQCTKKKGGGGGKSILYSSGCILMLGFGSDRNFFPTECFSMRNWEFTTARSFSVLCKF